VSAFFEAPPPPEFFPTHLLKKKNKVNPNVVHLLGTTMGNSIQIPVMKGWREGRITGGSDLEPK
jgi:hypothetical protein